MGNRLPHGLGGRGHWSDMLGGDGGEVNQDGNMGVMCGLGCRNRIVSITSLLHQQSPRWTLGSGFGKF
jgi:hypothetical protein